jgi:ATP adenylyltransferase
MERLWTPWRMQYVASADREPARCLFCELPGRQDDEANLLVKRGQRAFVVLNLYPYNTGHAMIAPYEHTADFPALAAETSAEILSLSQQVVGALAAEYQPDGFNLGMNLGRVAGAGVPNHLHVHVVPRWSGDANFMAITADTKVMPETLDRTYARVKRALDGSR